MGMNRYLDWRIDSRNPRTAKRAIPSGQISPTTTLIYSLLFATLFVFAAFQLNRLSGLLSIPMLLVLMMYSFWKRFSWGAHIYLGICLGLSPIAATIALQGYSPNATVMVGLAVVCWVAGFDILYSLQDQTFDKEQGLHSIPVRFGHKRSLIISRLLFSIMVTLLLFVGISSERGFFYFLGVCIVIGILIYEHLIIKKAIDSTSDLMINKAFFDANAWLSVIFYITTQLDFFLRQV